MGPQMLFFEYFLNAILFQLQSQFHHIMEACKGISEPGSLNHIRLDHLLKTISTGILRQTFRECWMAKYKSEWEKSSENKTKFIKLQAGKARTGSIQQQLLKTGDLENWDLALLIDSLQTLEGKKARYNLQILKKYRNQLAHCASASVQDAEFEEMWKQISEILQTYGVSQEKLDDVKRNPIAQLNSEQKSKKESHLNEANMAKAEELKTSGNQLFKNKKYDEAINVYSEAILLSGIPSEHLAALYSNRSISYLLSGDPELAKEDAKGAVYLWPSWWRAHNRLGRAYEALEKLDIALKHYEHAHRLKPTDIQAKTDVESCRERIIKRREDDHFNPVHFVPDPEDIAVQMNEEYGTSLTASALQRLQNSVGGVHQICGKGDEYKFGRGVKQDYAEAARWYTKAARKGSARGYHSLALLTMEGQGVMRNVAEAIRLFKAAAAQEPTITLENGFKITNAGVAEAEQALGYFYAVGVHFPQDTRKAMYWYERAIKHGSGIAAANMGNFYGEGKRVRADESKAIQYFKVSAFMKTVEAMESLAHIYLDSGDFVSSQKWYAFAVAKGSTSLKIISKKFKEKLGNDLYKPLDLNLFLQQLEDEVMKGSLRHLILDDSIYLRKVVEKNLALCGLKTPNTSGNATSRKTLGLTDPYRVKIIKLHRENIESMNLGMLGKNAIRAAPPSLKQNPNVDPIGLEPICFEDMKRNKDCIYEKFLLQLTLIEDAYLGSRYIGLIGQDEKGDIQRIFIYNFKQDKETQNTLGFGCNITILNPFFQMAEDNLPAIRVDDEKLILRHPKLKNTSLCRYCFKENSTLKCRKCMRVVYCSRACQKKDSDLLCHDLICKKCLWYPKPK